MRDIDIECWVKNCMWCPSPFSDAEMQLHYKLVRQQNMLVVYVLRWKRLHPIGPVPPSVFNKLRYLHEAGVEIDVAMLNSAPERRLVFVGLFVDGEQIKAAQPRIDQLRAADRELRRDRHARIESDLARRVAIKQHRRERRKAAVCWVFSTTGRGLSAVWAMAFKRDG